MIIRFLASEEYVKVEGVLRDHGMSLPLPELSRIAVAEDPQGRIIGLAVMQLAHHLEPVWVDEEIRGEETWKQLMEYQLAGAQSMVDCLGGKADIFCFSPRPGITRLLERGLGFVDTKWAVLRKSITRANSKRENG